jgi:hypothetical protein
MRSTSALDSGVRHVVGVGLQTLLIAAIVAALAIAAATVTHSTPSGAGSAFAASRNQTSWIRLAGGSTSAAATQPALGSVVAFEAGYPTTVKTPRYAVKCYQDGALVYMEARNIDESLQLGGGGSAWLTNGGAASCTADLFYFTYRGQVQTYHWLASTDFAAAG